MEITQKNFKVHVEHIDEFGKGLTDWEKNFIEDMLDEDSPSDPKIKVVQRIYDQKC